MSSIVENIIKNSPVSIDDNYKIRLKTRQTLLVNRREMLISASIPGVVEYENGMAARFYPNVNYSRSDIVRMKRMISVINKELDEIGRVK